MAGLEIPEDLDLSNLTDKRMIYLLVKKMKKNLFQILLFKRENHHFGQSIF